MSFFSNLSVRNKLLISILPLFGVIIVSLVLLVMSSFEKILLKQQQHSLQETVAKTRKDLDIWISSRERDLQILTWNNELLARNEKTGVYLETYLKNSPFLENAFVANQDGVQTFDAIGGKSVGLDLRTIPFAVGSVTSAKEQKTFISDAFPAPHSGRPVVLMTAPIVENGMHTGMIGAPVELFVFSQMFIDDAKIGEHGFITILDLSGNVISHPDKAKIFKENLFSKEWGKAFTESSKEPFIFVDESAEKLGYFEKSEKTKWVIFASIPTEEYMAPIRTLEIFCWTLGLAALLVAGVIVTLFSQKIYNGLQASINTLSSASESIDGSGVQLHSASQRLSSSSMQGAASLQESVASLEEMTGMMKTSADNVKQAAQLSLESQKITTQGEAEINQLREAMAEISGSAKKIGEITSVIDDLAFQTNLLALNASVEAARAGEHGKGFAVVADAVRSLAQKSAVAAKDISTLINESVTRTSKGAEVAEKSEQVFVRISAAIKKISAINTELASAIDQQSTGLEQINQSMNQLDNVTQENAASAEQTAQFAASLKDQSVNLKQVVEELNRSVKGRAA